MNKILIIALGFASISFGGCGGGDFQSNSEGVNLVEEKGTGGEGSESSSSVVTSSSSSSSITAAVNSSSGSGGSVSSSSVGSGCDAKTCEEQGANCGQVDTGCGQVIECGSCGGLESCGASTPNQNTGELEPGTANVCGGGCVRRAHFNGYQDEWMNCGKLSDPLAGGVYNVYQCEREYMEDPIGTNCEPYNPEGGAIATYPSAYWCC